MKIIWFRSLLFTSPAMVKISFKATTNAQESVKILKDNRIVPDNFLL